MKYLKRFNESSDRPNIKKHDIDGFIVYQGKDARSNDYLTMEMSDDEDYWFHVKGVPGSHVVIKIKDNLPSLETIKKVAKIAANNSKSTESKVTVVYCKKKFVHKKKDMNPGQVSVDYKNSEQIDVYKK